MLILVAFFLVIVLGCHAAFWIALLGCLVSVLGADLVWTAGAFAWLGLAAGVGAYSARLILRALVAAED